MILSYKSSFVKTIISCAKNIEEDIETRVRNYDSLETKTAQSILSYPESAKQH